VPLTAYQGESHVNVESDRGSGRVWEDAAQTAVTRANETVRNVRSIYIKNMEASVENGKIKKYRINGKISFTLGS
jgi:dodecin